MTFTLETDVYDADHYSRNSFPIVKLSLFKAWTNHKPQLRVIFIRAWITKYKLVHVY